MLKEGASLTVFLLASLLLLAFPLLFLQYLVADTRRKLLIKRTAALNKTNLYVSHEQIPGKLSLS